MAGKARQLGRKGLFCRYYITAFLAEFLMLGVCIGLHRLFIYRGGMFQTPELVDGDMSSPTWGRFIYAIGAFAVSILLAGLAGKTAAKGYNFPAFILGTFAGTLLWQSLGEDMWNFSIGGVHFISLEDCEVLPLAVLAAIAMLYCWRHNSLDWGVWCAVLSLWLNWFGHIFLVGVRLLLASRISASVWGNTAGVGLAVILFITGLTLALRKSKTPRQMILCAILCYQGVALAVSGIFKM